MILVTVLLTFLATLGITHAAVTSVSADLAIHYASHLIEGLPLDVTPEELHLFKVYAQYAGASYCNIPRKEGEQLFCRADICPGRGHNATYHSTWPPKSSDVTGFVAVDHDLTAIVVSFRGSSSFKNWYQGLKFAALKWEEAVCKGCKVHWGFQETEREIREEVTHAVRELLVQYPGYSITVTGHSFGGAISNILGAHLRMDGFNPVTTYTYGAPRVGNREFAAFVRAQEGRNYRITHFNDIVPTLPYLWDHWRHVEPEYWLKEGGWERTRYTVDDLKVCVTDGACLSGWDVVKGWSTWLCAHSYYLCAISMCGNGPKFPVCNGFSIGGGKNPYWAWVDDGTEFEEFMASIKIGLARDMEYVASMHNDSLLAQSEWEWGDE